VECQLIVTIVASRSLDYVADFRDCSTRRNEVENIIVELRAETKLRQVSRAVRADAVRCSTIHGGGSFGSEGVRVLALANLGERAVVFTPPPV
jgi:hypothetical protein